MESSQRISRSQGQDEMNPDSAYSLPTAREKISARIESETKLKLTAIMEIWRTQARVEIELRAKLGEWNQKRLKDALDAVKKNIDLTHVVDSLLKVAADRELAPWGGFPDSPEKLKAMLTTVEKQAKK